MIAYSVSSSPNFFSDSTNTIKIKRNTAWSTVDKNLDTPFLGFVCWKKNPKNGFLRRRNRKLIVVNELGGQYEDTFNDVKIEIINYFTFKAIRTVLEQLYEMNPPQYIWFHNFVSNNAPNNGKTFLQALVKERRELAERVMITRLSLYGRWIKKCDHGEIYKEISEENLKLLRDRLMETIIWPPDEDDDESTDKK